MATAIREFVDTRIPGACTSAEYAEDALRAARRTAVEVRHAAEDLATDAVREVRRHPLRSIGAAVGVGLVAGAFAGFTAGWWVRR
jgi:ElaB/YqjD/DUF883 family membrane-anchored ribosome-binding protein